MSSRVRQKLQNVTRILCGIKRSMDDPTDEKILEEFTSIFRGAWGHRIFDTHSKDQKAAMASVVLPSALESLFADKSAGLTIINNILKTLRDEDKAAERRIRGSSG